MRILLLERMKVSMGGVWSQTHQVGRGSDIDLRGGIRGGETVAGEAGGLPLGTRTASRSAAPGHTLFLCGRSTNNHRFLRYIRLNTFLYTRRIDKSSEGELIP